METETKPKAPPPSKEEAKAANAGEYAGDTRVVKKIGGNKVLKAVLGGGVAVAGGAIAYEAVPAVHRAVDSAFLDNLKGQFITEVSVNPEVFDPKATSGVVGPNTIFYIPQEEFNKLPLADEKGNPIFDFPWDKNHPVSREYKAGLSSSWASWSAKGEVSIDTNTKNEWSESTVLPAGFEFTTVYPGRLFWGGSIYDEEASRKSPSNPNGLAVYRGPITAGRIEFTLPDGTFYFVGFSVVEDKGGKITQLSIQPLVDAPYTDESRNGKQGTSVERGQKIFSTIKEGKIIMNTEAQKNGSLLFKDRMPGNFSFQTGKDATGAQKILVSDAK